MKYLVVYDSKTGNTQLLANELYEILKNKVDVIDILTVDEFNKNPVEADVYFVGFWTDRGSCSLAVTDALECMENKKIALFATCGMGNSPQYYKQIENNVSVWLPDECENMGFFICQGKIPEQLYEKMMEKIPEEQKQEILYQYELGKNHPDSSDINNLCQFANRVIMDSMLEN